MTIQRPGTVLPTPGLPICWKVTQSGSDQTIDKERWLFVLTHGNYTVRADVAFPVQCQKWRRSAAWRIDCELLSRSGPHSSDAYLTRSFHNDTENVNHFTAVMSQVHSVQVQVQVLSSKYKYEYKYLYSQVRYIQIQASG